MQILRRPLVAVILTACLSQEPQMHRGYYVDAATGINFTTWTADVDEDGNGAYTFGMVLPADAMKVDANEYLGLLRCQIFNPANQTGWCGIAHDGFMAEDLLLVAHPLNGSVVMSFHWATGYFQPDPYLGDAMVTQVSSKINATSYEVIYRCRGCWFWHQAEGRGGGVSTDMGTLLLGHAQSFDTPVGDDACPGGVALPFHDNGFGQWDANLTGVANPNYQKWAALATKTVTVNCTETNVAKL